MEEECKRDSPETRSKAAPDCTQTRLGKQDMYTGDPFALVVGVKCAARLFAVWKEVTGNACVVMAGADKRQLGADLVWI